MAGEASIQEFLAFLRTSKIPEAQIPTFKKVAEQLLIGTGNSDLRAVSTDQANRWRDALRTRNLTPQQMALISRGIAGVQAFQRKLAAPRAATPVGTPPAAAPPSADAPPPEPAPAPPPPAASPEPPPAAPPRPAPPAKPAQPPARAGSTGGKKWGAVAVLGLLVGGSIAYTIVASRKAMQETRGDKETLSQRQAVRKAGIFYPSYAFSRQPSVGCEAGALAQVNQAVDLAEKGEGRFKAVELLEGALSKDPACVAAARVLSILEFQIGGAGAVEKLKDRWVHEANKSPANAPAQLMAAYASRQLGDGDAYRKYLDRAQAANPRQPLLPNAWASYWDLFARPRDFAKELAANREEVQASGDPATMINLAKIYLEVGDYDRAREVCNRFYELVPKDQDYPRAATCLSVALRGQDAASEKTLLQRFLALGPANVGEACVHADLAARYLTDTCRFEEALKEADAAIEQGCLVPGSGHRRTALIALRRYEEAAVPAPNGRYWDGESGEKDTRPVAYPDRDHRALALAMVGRDQQALEILRPIAEQDELAQILIGMIEEGVLKQRVAAAPDCALRTERAERLAGAAGGYIGYRILDDAWPLQDAAMALNPRSPTGWANKVYMLSIDGKLKEAAEMGEKALALGIEDPYLAGNLGYVYQQLGDCNKAIPLLRQKMLGQPWTVPNYTNLAKCLDKVGRGGEAAIVWGYVQGGKPRVFWWMYAGLAIAAVGLYLLGKLALIKLLPDRFGHLNFP